MTPFLDHEDRKQRTAEAFADPQAGDRFCERLSFWVYVVGRDGDRIMTLEASSPCVFPDDGKVRSYTPAEFRARFHFASGPWVYLEDRGNDVSGWLEKATGNQE